MALVSMRELLDHAAANQYGIPAFNVNNLEQVQAGTSTLNVSGFPAKYEGRPFALVITGSNAPRILHEVPR